MIWPCQAFKSLSSPSRSTYLWTSICWGLLTWDWRWASLTLLCNGGFEWYAYSPLHLLCMMAEEKEGTVKGCWFYARESAALVASGMIKLNGLLRTYRPCARLSSMLGYCPNLILVQSLPALSYLSRLILFFLNLLLSSAALSLFSGVGHFLFLTSSRRGPCLPRSCTDMADLSWWVSVPAWKFRRRTYLQEGGYPLQICRWMKLLIGLVLLSYVHCQKLL